MTNSSCGRLIIPENVSLSLIIRTTLEIQRLQSHLSKLTGWSITSELTRLLGPRLLVTYLKDNGSRYRFGLLSLCV